ncbi:hypothetical protein CDAR_470821 [Caerostris darwini]|uniref:Uncharacterized protein n=1 Tax=Caerostris darwini TaxID=1538125 RepID=A0AAV4VJ09_9ARAC|nr:hypothetical protein CDAR_470821 [Caerostris darwini]
MRARYKRVKGTETSKERKRRLESARVSKKRVRAAETLEGHEIRLESTRARYKRNGINDNEDVTPVEPSVAIKEEPIEFDSEPPTFAEIVIQNSKKDNEDAIPVEPAVVVKQEPTEFYPEPSASADIVIKDELVVCSEEYTNSSADVPPSTEPTSHVTLSVACLGPANNLTTANKSRSIFNGEYVHCLLCKSDVQPAKVFIFLLKKEYFCF